MRSAHTATVLLDVYFCERPAYLTLCVNFKIQVLAGFSIDLNFQDVMTSKLKNLDVSVRNLEVMQ